MLNKSSLPVSDSILKRDNRTVTAKAGKLTLVVLISGGGTNLQAIIDRIETEELQAKIALVVSSTPEAYGLVRARDHGIPTAVVDYRRYGKKQLPQIPERLLPDSFPDLIRRQRIYRGLLPAEVWDRLARLVLAEQEMIGLLEPLGAELVCLAGFMRLLSPYFVSHFQGHGRYRIMNIHPALLPAFPGEHGYADTFSYGSKIGGITVHFVDEGEDTGPVIAQAIYPIWPEDTLELVRQRGLHLEYALYPQCIHWMAQGHLQVTVGAAGRPVVQILDPNYPDFLQGLIRQAFSRPA
jgi:phosphoribosylglycinamide formyltransferase-1